MSLPNDSLLGSVDSWQDAISEKSQSLRELLARPSVNLALTELEWEPNCSNYASLANSLEAGYECHIRQPFDWEMVSDKFTQLTSGCDPDIAKQYRLRCLRLCRLFHEVAESLQTIMLYGMIGGRPEVLDFPWHVDRVSLTMVDTVVGPGTLWVADEDVRRSAFAEAYIAETSGPPAVTPTATVRNVPTGTVAFFKGELRREHDYPAVQRAIEDNQGREFNRGSGLVHASPTLPLGHKRLFFCAMTFAVPSYLRNC